LSYSSHKITVYLISYMFLCITACSTSQQSTPPDDESIANLRENLKKEFNVDEDVADGMIKSLGFDIVNESIKNSLETKSFENTTVAHFKIPFSGKENNYKYSNHLEVYDGANLKEKILALKKDPDGSRASCIFSPLHFEPVIIMIDEDSDGIYDKSTMNIIGNDGKVIRILTDYDFDGQAEIRIECNETPGSYVFINDSWHKIVGRDDKPGIVINSDWYEISLESNKFIIKESE